MLGCLLVDSMLLVRCLCICDRRNSFNGDEFVCDVWVYLDVFAFLWDFLRCGYFTEFVGDVRLCIKGRVQCLLLV